MRNQLTELEGVIIKLEQMNSLFNCMCRSYFEDREPNKNDLVASYTDYTNVIEVIRDTVYSQTHSLSEVTYKLYDICKELKKLANRNIALLEGGGAND